jgi:hypothetical protein
LANAYRAGSNATATLSGSTYTVSYSSAFTAGATVTVQLHGSGQNLGVIDKSVLFAVTASTTSGFSFQIVNEAGANLTPTAATLKVDYIAIAPN